MKTTLESFNVLSLSFTAKNPDQGDVTYVEFLSGPRLPFVKVELSCVARECIPQPERLCLDGAA